MPLNLGVGHTFLKAIVYLGVLQIGYSSEGNTGADVVSASLVLERLGTHGESRPPGWGFQQRRDGRWPIRRRGRAGLRLREGLAVESWEAQLLAWCSTVEAAPQARSVP